MTGYLVEVDWMPPGALRPTGLPLFDSELIIYRRSRLDAPRGITTLSICSCILAADAARVEVDWMPPGALRPPRCRTRRLCGMARIGRSRLDAPRGITTPQLRAARAQHMAVRRSRLDAPRGITTKRQGIRLATCARW